MAVEAFRPHLQGALRYCGLIGVLIVGLAAFLKFRASADCTTQLNDGKWAVGQWRAHTCFTHRYQQREIQRCLSNFSGVVVIGDSIHTMYTILTSSDSGSEHKLFIEGKYIENAPEKYSKIAKSFVGKAVLVIDQPLQFHSPGAKNIIASCADNIDALISSQRELLKNAPFSRIVTMAPVITSDATEEKRKCSHLAEKKYAELSNSSLVYLSAFAVPILERGSLRHGAGYLPQDLNLLLNLYCNTPYNATCCVDQKHGHFYGMTGILVMVAIYGGLWLVWLTGATEPIVVYLEGCAIDGAKLRQAFNCVGLVVLCAVYYTAAERLQLFHITNKSYSPLLFCLWLLLSLVVGISTFAKGPQKFLSSEQSSSLIGWIALVLLGLDYTALNEEQSTYLMADLLLGAVVLLFSYRQFMYFWECGAVQYGRVFMVIVKINAFPLLLMVLLGVPYHLYTIPALLTWSVLIVCISMGTSVQTSKVQVQARKNHILFTMAKLVLLFVIISFIFSFKFIISLTEVSLHTNSDGVVKLLSAIGHYKHMPLYGVILGYITGLLRVYHMTFVSKYERILKIAGILLSQSIIVCYCVWIFLCRDMESCVHWQSYFSVLPIVAGIYLCNCTNSLQTLYSHFFKKCGSAFIVLYCTHLHVLCSFKGHGLLALFPHIPVVNHVAVVWVFLVVTHWIIQTEDAFADIVRSSSSGSSSPASKTSPHDGVEAPQHV